MIPDQFVTVEDIFGEEGKDIANEVVSFLNPLSDEAAQEASKTEDHLLNAILNLDHIVDAHMAGNGHSKVKADVPVPPNESNPPKVTIKPPAGKEVEITSDDIIEDPELLYDFTISAESLEWKGGIDYAMLNRMKAAKE